MMSTQERILGELEEMAKNANLTLVVDKAYANTMYVRPQDETFTVAFNMFMDFQTSYFIAKIVDDAEETIYRWRVENGKSDQLQEFLRAMMHWLGLD